MVHESISGVGCRDIGITTLGSGAWLAFSNSLGGTSSHANLHGVLGKYTIALNDRYTSKCTKDHTLITPTAVHEPTRAAMTAMTFHDAPSNLSNIEIRPSQARKVSRGVAINATQALMPYDFSTLSILQSTNAATTTTLLDGDPRWTINMLTTDATSCDLVLDSGS